MYMVVHTYIHTVCVCKSNRKGINQSLTFGLVRYCMYKYITNYSIGVRVLSNSCSAHWGPVPPTPSHLPSLLHFQPSSRMVGCMYVTHNIHAP